MKGVLDEPFLHCNLSEICLWLCLFDTAILGNRIFEEIALVIKIRSIVLKTSEI